VVDLVNCDSELLRVTRESGGLREAGYALAEIEELIRSRVCASRI
jgi:hypothetical protein